MFHFIYLAVSMILVTVLLTFVHSLTNIPRPIFPIMLGISLLIFTIWIGCILSEIRDTIKFQLSDFHSIDKYKKDKESYQKEMEAYKTEMKAELLQKYKEFEENIMESIKDSKIIATVLKQSGYASVLKNYDYNIDKYLRQIHDCDRKIEGKIRDMKVRQANPFYTYCGFIPKDIIYK